MTNTIFSGNILIIASSTACMISLTWGEVQFLWSSVHVLVPLILGLVGLAGFMAYDAKIAEYPIVNIQNCRSFCHGLTFVM